jgi:glycosyltransferase involved in cell wall biosynthesis
MFRLGKLLERLLYHRADRMTCVSHTMQRHLTVASRKTMYVVYNGVCERRLAQEPIPRVERRILYAGNLGRAQGLEVLVEAFAAARRLSGAMAGWTVDLVGSGALEGRVACACIRDGS